MATELLIVPEYTVVSYEDKLGTTLVELEKTIERADVDARKAVKMTVACVMEWASAVRKIRDNKLWRNEYMNFADYLDRRWNVGIAVARNRIRLYEALNYLNDEGSHVSFSSCSAVVALDRVPREWWQKVIDQAVAADGVTIDFPKIKTTIEKMQKKWQEKPATTGSVAKEASAEAVVVSGVAAGPSGQVNESLGIDDSEMDAILSGSGDDELHEDAPSAVRVGRVTFDVDSVADVVANKFSTVISRYPEMYRDAVKSKFLLRIGSPPVASRTIADVRQELVSNLKTVDAQRRLMELQALVGEFGFALKPK